MLDVLQAQNYATSAIAIDSHGVILDGDTDLNRPVDVIPNRGPGNFLAEDSLKDNFKTLNGEVFSNSGKYADLWSQYFIDGIDKAQALRDAIDTVVLMNSWNLDSYIKRTLHMVSKLIVARDARGVNRDAFYIRLGSYDHHSTMKPNLDPAFTQINAGLNAFKEEMISQGLLDKITLVLTSEFARTLSANGGEGTDHAWGGNYFVMGGELRGGRILGEYPGGFNTTDPTNDGRGRLVPTTSWDSVWNGVAQVSLIIAKLIISL